MRISKLVLPAIVLLLVATVAYNMGKQSCGEGFTFYDTPPPGVNAAPKPTAGCGNWKYSYDSQYGGNGTWVCPETASMGPGGLQSLLIGIGVGVGLLILFGVGVWYYNRKAS